MKKLTGAEKAWLAAALDGEGCIYIHLVTRPGARNQKRLKLIVNISNTNRAFVDRAKTITGRGVIATMKQNTAARRYGKTFVPCFVWMLQNQQEVLELLPQILPHLIIKRAKAEAVLAYLRRRTRASHASLPNVTLWNEIADGVHLKKLSGARGFGSHGPGRGNAQTGDAGTGENTRAK